MLAIALHLPPRTCVACVYRNRYNPNVTEILALGRLRKERLAEVSRGRRRRHRLGAWLGPARRISAIVQAVEGRSAGRVRVGRRLPGRHVSRRLYGALRECDLCIALVSEEVAVRNPHCADRRAIDWRAPAGRAGMRPDRFECWWSKGQLVLSEAIRDADRWTSSAVPGTADPRARPRICNARSSAA